MAGTFVSNTAGPIPQASPTIAWPQNDHPQSRDMHPNTLGPNAKLTGSNTASSHTVHSISDVYTRLVCMPSSIF